MESTAKHALTAASTGLEIQPPGESGTEPDTSPAGVLAAARRYVAAGLSVVPITTNGEKRPCGWLLPRRWDETAGAYRPTWKPYQERLPSEKELLAWYQSGTRFGLAVVCGAVSGGAPGFGLEIIDFDDADVYEHWLARVETCMPGLVARLPRVRSPGPGVHVYFRSKEFSRKQKLACSPVLDTAGLPKKATLIELLGDGGTALAPPSPGECHPTGRLYRLAEGSPDLTQLPSITAAERAVLLTTALTFDHWPKPERPVRSVPQLVPVRRGGGRPGDDFNERATWEQILEPHGWQLVSECVGVSSWRRPGKSEGTSATTGYCGAAEGDDLLYVFTSNGDPFEMDCAYSKFHAYTLLEHDGDFGRAAQHLRLLGYGAPRQSYRCRR